MALVETSPTPYQLMPGLTDEERASLRLDIEAHGIRVPIDVDEDDNILDGHHRAWIAAGLGIACPRRLVPGLDDEAKRAHAVSVNVFRRNLSKDQRRELVARLRSEGMSQRAIAEATGTSQSTVRDDLADVSSSTHAEPETIVGKDGKRYAAKAATHECEVCAAIFTRPVWHCDRCDQHWDDGQVCATCATGTTSIDNASGEIIDAAPDPTTQPVQPKRPAPAEELTPEQQRAKDIDDGDKRAARYIAEMTDDWPYFWSYLQGKRRAEVHHYMDPATREVVAEIEEKIRSFT